MRQSVRIGCIARAALASILLCLAWPAASTRAAPEVTSFALANGLQVVVIEDHRAPVVTHMVWYRVGAADDPPGKSGLAHFLEHLMFKETARLKSGEFTRILTRLGGRHNALTTHDTTSYFQRVAKQHLRAVMELEADRMLGLRLADPEVLTERDVIKEERRSSIDASPLATLNEEMLAQLYLNHPYGRPVLGWTHEMSALTKLDATTFYERHYGPDNAVLIVAGDVTPEEVRGLADSTYGRNPRRFPGTAGAPDRSRPQEPPAVAARSLRVEDARAGPSPIVLRFYQAPSQRTAKPGDAEALYLMTRIIGGDDTSRLYRRLVLERKLAVQAGADYQSGGRDSGRVTLLAVATRDASVAEIERALDDVVTLLRTEGPTEEELSRVKRGAEADRVFDRDNQEKLARRYGEAVTNGTAPEDVAASDRRVDAVTRDDVRRVAAENLLARRSVTGVLARPAAESAVPAAQASGSR